MQRLREHPIAASALAFGIAAVAVVAIAAASGFGAFAAAWDHLHPGWLLLAIGCSALALARVHARAGAAAAPTTRATPTIVRHRLHTRQCTNRSFEA